MTREEITGKKSNYLAQKISIVGGLSGRAIALVRKVVIGKSGEGCGEENFGSVK